MHYHYRIDDVGLACSYAFECARAARMLSDISQTCMHHAYIPTRLNEQSWTEFVAKSTLRHVDWYSGVESPRDWCKRRHSLNKKSSVLGETTPSTLGNIIHALNWDSGLLMASSSSNLLYFKTVSIRQKIIRQI